jgi:hypothetical protein
MRSTSKDRTISNETVGLSQDTMWPASGMAEMVAAGFVVRTLAAPAA